MFLITLRRGKMAQMSVKITAGDNGIGGKGLTVTKGRWRIGRTNVGFRAEDLPYAYLRFRV